MLESQTPQPSNFPKSFTSKYSTRLRFAKHLSKSRMSCSMKIITKMKSLSFNSILTIQKKSVRRFKLQKINKEVSNSISQRHSSSSSQFGSNYLRLDRGRCRRSLVVCLRLGSPRSKGPMGLASQEWSSRSASIKKIGSSLRMESP